MYLQGSLTLLQQWERWRGTRELPARHDIKPLDIKTLLRDIFILDINENQDVRFRLAGTRLCASFGRELRAQDFSALWQRIDKPGMVEQLELAYLSYEPASFDAVGVTGTGREVAYEITLLPLQAEEKRHHVLGLATPKAFPFWFSSEPLIGFRATSRYLKPFILDEKQSPARINIPSLQTNARQIRHLTVLDGGKV